MMPRMHADDPCLEADVRRIHAKLGEVLEEFYGDPDSAPVVPYRSKGILFAELHRPSPPEKGAGFDEALDRFRRDILPGSIRTWHPLFLNQMFAGAPPEAVAGDCLASMLNATMATWEAAPAATIVERDVIEWMASLLGMPAGSSGILLPGGTMANIFALAMARDRVLIPDAVRTGLHGAPRGAILCSEGSHYSIANAARLIGVGTDGLVRIPCNDRLEILTEAVPHVLDDCAARGLTPFAIVLTAGIPITGGVDPIAPVLPICRERGIHVHVDAAMGGTLALTAGGRHRLDGIEQADSVTWDAHKWLHVPLSCSALIVPDVRRLKEAFGNPAGYLFHADADPDPAVDDLGRYTALCAKRFDALKLWILWHSWGTEGFRRLAESRLALAYEFHGALASSGDFAAAAEPATPIVCFRYLPSGHESMAPAAQDSMHEWIRGELRRRGHAFVNITRLRGREHFRAVLVNPLTRMQHLLALLDQIRALGREYLQAGGARK
jgi:L-2,4-diaminobutyrate decarboxylase